MGEENKLPSPDMGVRDPLLRVQMLRRARGRSIKPFVLLKHALSSCSLPDGDIRMKNKEKAPFSRGAYYVVRNPQNYPTETFFGGDPAQGAFDAVIRRIAPERVTAIFR